MDTNSIIQNVIKCCYDVHHELGHGFSEKIYQKSLEIALDEHGIKVAAQYALSVYYHDILVGEYFADVFVEDTLIVELKALSAVDASHKSQVLNYLKASRKKMGLLVNFGVPKLDIHRLYNNESASIPKTLTN